VLIKLTSSFQMSRKIKCSMLLICFNLVVQLLHLQIEIQKKFNLQGKYRQKKSWLKHQS